MNTITITLVIISSMWFFRDLSAPEGALEKDLRIEDGGVFHLELGPHKPTPPPPPII